jgi:CheY-like chemotaxis protein
LAGFKRGPFAVDAAPVDPATLVPVDQPTILVVDDEPEVHEDFRRCLGPARHSQTHLDALRRSLFSAEPGTPSPPPAQSFRLEHVSAGQDAAAVSSQRLHEGHGIALAFVDMRMSPGWNGLETIRALWRIDRRMQIVLCTAYSDFTWDKVLAAVGDLGSLHLLRKPFEPGLVRRYAEVLCRKWELAGNKHAHATRGGGTIA